jgi:hypothetical protein
MNTLICVILFMFTLLHLNTDFQKEQLNMGQLIIMVV